MCKEVFLLKYRINEQAQRFGSGKIKYSILSKLIEDKKMTSKEIDLFLWLAIRQSDQGIVSYVKYKEVCADIGFSIQEFYNCVYALESRQYISIKERHGSHGWHIQIIDNTFATAADDKQRYLNIHRDFLFEKTFIEMRANEKKLVLKIITTYNTAKDYYIKIEAIIDWLQTSNTQLIRSYIEKIKAIFSIYRKKYNNKNSNVFVIEKNNVTVGDAYGSISDKFLNYWLRSTFRVKKILCTPDALKDLIALFKQYKNHFNLVYDVMVTTLTKTDNTIEPKLIHSIITTELNASSR